MDDSPIQLLLIAANRSDYDRVRGLLGRPGASRIDICWESSLAAGLDALAGRRYDVCLVDSQLDEHSGLDLLEESAANGLVPPIVLLDTATQHNAAQDAMRKRAVESIAADRLDGLLLERTIRYARDQNRAQNERRECEERYRQLLAAVTKYTQMLREKDEQLRHGQKMEAIGRLAEGVAHEFNNLLEAIGGHAQFAVVGLAPTEPRYDDLQQIIQATNRAAILTRQLLGFGRRQALSREIVAANQIVDNLVEMIRPLIGEHIALEICLDEAAGTVYADPMAVEEALLNLGMNARDAMPDGGRIVIKTERLFVREPLESHHGSIWPGRYVRFTVADTGCGVPKEIRDRIFEPFFTTKPAGKGTGLGLASVYGAVQQHNGAIRVHSSPGRGASFEMYLPTVSGTLNQEPPNALLFPLSQNSEDWTAESLLKT